MPFIDESTLDDPTALRERDSRDTLRALATAGAQVREALTLADEAGVERLVGDRPRSVVVAGLGGSAVVADVLHMMAEPRSPVPVTARRNLPLPGWVGPLDLVIAVSLSGRASGPLAVAAEAARRGASLLTVGAADSPLAEVTARARGVHVDIGRGRVSSRTALWSLLTPVLVAADRLGLVQLTSHDALATADRLDEIADACRPGSESFVNPAKSVALRLSETVPVVLGDGALSGVAARRAAAMFSRTARVPAHHGELPDAASEITACLDGPFTHGGGSGTSLRSAGDIFADPFLDGPAQPSLGLLLIRDADPSPFVDLADGVVATAEAAGATVAEIAAGPGHPVTRLAGQMAMVDYISTYLAIGWGLDPSVSRHITALRDHTDR